MIQMMPITAVEVLDAKLQPFARWILLAKIPRPARSEIQKVLRSQASVFALTLVVRETNLGTMSSRLLVAKCKES